MFTFSVSDQNAGCVSLKSSKHICFLPHKTILHCLCWHNAAILCVLEKIMWSNLTENTVGADGNTAHVLKVLEVKTCTCWWKLFMDEAQ